MTFLHCAFSNVPSNFLPERRQSHTGCTCLSFLQCVSSNVSSNCLHLRMHNHTGCICLLFLHCVFSNVSSNCLPEQMHSHTCRICLTFHNKQNLVEQTLPGCQQQLSHSGRKTAPTPIDSFPPSSDPSNTLQLHLLPPRVPSADKCLQVCPPKSIPRAVFVTLSPPPL